MKAPKPIKQFKKYFRRKNPAIQEIVREATAGGVIYRRNKKGEIEILLAQDSKDRWTIPKGHIEEGESAKETAKREIQEEAGLKEMSVLNWLGKIRFRYRRKNSLVLMTTQIFLVRAEGDTDNLKKEDWMHGLAWFSVPEALEKIEYDDIGKVILLGVKKIRQANL